MNEQRRQAAIEAGARALYGDCQPPWDELPEALRWADRKDAAAVIDAAAPHLEADALRGAANAWQVNGWANDLPTGGSRPALILGMAQRSVDFLRTRADRIERGDAP